ncbi:BRCT domain-containing protein [Ottowia sp.]|uniref:BRCT domain-containing protein n=1 Tax=Ottowia sp. TaxID=1898956 RepID=UPI003A8B51AF
MTDDYHGPTSNLQRQYRIERACSQLLGVIGGITADGHLHDLEIQYLRTWLNEQRDKNDNWLHGSALELVEHVLADGVVTDAERADLLVKLQDLSGTHFADTGAATAETTAFPVDAGPALFDSHSYCLTGKFLFGGRAKCKAATEAAGGVVVDSVTRSTSFLVIGAAGATVSWKQASYGAKIDAAMRLKQSGLGIQILDEATWTMGVSGPSEAAV